MKLKIALYVRANLLYPFQCETPCIKAGKLALRPWLSCPYNENTLMDLPSSVGVGGKTANKQLAFFLHFAFAERVWEYIALIFFSCRMFAYLLFSPASILGQKDAISMETDRQTDPSAPHKGDTQPRADWLAIDSPKNRTNQFVFLP